MPELPQGFSEPGLGDSPFTVNQVVEWGAMDSLGHVNNAVYLRWFENVRFHYFEQIGLNAVHAELGIGPILARATVDFRAPVTFPDDVLLSTQCVRLGTKSFTLYNRAWSTKDRRMVAEGEAIIVMMDYRGDGASASIAVPAVLRASLEALDGPFEAPGRQT
jgi:acyl-CoA thioester hydrolase